MSNLIVEYQKRHHNSSIPVNHDGLCFFDIQGEPSLIAMTSLSCRSFGTCPKCEDKKPSIIVELFQSGYNGMFLLTRHDHVDPTIDLYQYVKDHGHRNAKPFMAKKPRDLEFWLWNFTTHGTPTPRGFRYAEYESDLQRLERMFWSAVKQPKLYNAYYIAYEAFLPKRAYLLYE